MFSFTPQGLHINNNSSPGHAGPSVHAMEEIIESSYEYDYHTNLDEK